MAKPKKPASRKSGQGSNPKASGATAATPKDTAPKPDATKASAKPTPAPAPPEAKPTTVEKAVTKAQPASAAAATKSSDLKASETPKAADATPTEKPKTPAKPSDTPDAKSTTAAKTPSQASTASKPDIKPKPETTKVEEKPAEPAKPKSTPPTPAPVAEKRSGGFVPLALGGLVAGAIGFIAAEMNAFGLRENTDALRTTVAEQQDRIAALDATIAEMSTPDLTPLEEGLGTLTEMTGTLDTRLTAIEDRPVVTSTGEIDIEAYENQFAALEASVEAQKAELDRLLENALSVEQATAETARLAVVQGALTEIAAAITEGAPFADAITTLEENGVDDIPAPLTDVAADGVITLTALQAGFSDAARDALAAARAAGAQEGEQGFGGFLRRSLGARSVEPREGSDPDAVLSRVDAAVRNGAMSDALTEIDTLPAVSQDAMGSWLSDARTRVTVRDAVQNLSERLTAN